jgi:cation:H+ antiporter
MLYLQIAGGLLLLVVGGDALVRGAVSIATRIGISQLLVGITVVGFGTSTPELVTSLQAASIGASGIAIGNVIGSNTANIMLILGIAALISPLGVSRAAFRRDGAVLCIASMLCVGIVLFGYLSWIWGFVFVALLVGYVGYTYLGERQNQDVLTVTPVVDATSPQAAPARLWVAVIFAVGGIALTILGARLLVDGAISLAGAAGLSETVVGLTIVAVGTSLPELVTSVTAALRRKSDVAFGNVVGSNIYNILGILGVTALVSPISVPKEIAEVDIWVMVAATMLLVLFSVTGWRLNRIEGGVFLFGYVAYTTWLITSVG